MIKPVEESVINDFLEDKLDCKIIEKIKDIIYNQLTNLINENDKYYYSILIAYFVRCLGDRLSTNINNDEEVFLDKRLNDELLNGDITERKFGDIRSETFLLLKKYPKAFKYLLKFENKDLDAYILGAENEEKCLAQSVIPQGLIKLVTRLLEIKKDLTIANFNAGTGTFECIVDMEYKDNKFFMFETDIQNRIIAKVRKKLLSMGTIKDFNNYNQFPTEIFDNFNNGRTFDRIFANIPIGTSASYLNQYDYYKKLKEFSWIYQKINIVDWIYCKRMVEMLKPNGIAVAFVSNGATFNSSDLEIRKDLVKQGFIKAVIQMPEKLLRFSNINFSIVVLSKGNKFCRMIDASSYYSKCRRYNILQNNHIKGIVKLYNNKKIENNLIIDLSIEDIAAQDYSLNCSRYINKKTNLNCVKLKDLLISEVSRGMNISAKQLDNLSSNEDTNYKFLTLSNINSGLINKEMISIYNPDLKSKKYIVEENNIVIAKPSNPIKIAVAGDECKDFNIVASDNIFILKVDENKVNPYYLKAFFESEIGKRELKMAVSGTTTTMITKQQLENIDIPIMSMKKQNEIAENYKYNENQIILLKERLAILQDKLKDVWRADENE